MKPSPYLLKNFSVHNLGKLVSLERLVIEELSEQADQLQGAVDNIEEYLREVRQVYSQCGQAGCSEGDTEAIIGNPIHNFQLLKRVIVFWKNVQVKTTNDIIFIL